ncbi:MAG: T9SS type A sorting domain-containing protein [Candidatus Hydrothermae bacterium]|nr:T9SS type A sorting domain-containing protein [Candidatus Hydrothermae bacterium]
MITGPSCIFSGTVPGVRLARTPVATPHPRPVPSPHLRVSIQQQRLRLEARTTLPVQLRLFNALGRPVWTRTLPALQGVTVLTLPRALPAGIYWLRVQTGDLKVQRRTLLLP